MKKLLLFLLFLLLLILIIVYGKHCCVTDKQELSPFVDHQLIVNFNGNDLVGFERDVNLLGYKVKARCPCSDSLMLLEDTTGRVTLNPDGDVKPPIKDYGGGGSIVSRNYKFDKGNFSKLLENIPDSFPLPVAPTNTVIVSTVDSGVDPSNPQLKSHLYPSILRTKYCGPTNKLEGFYGLNIPFIMGRATSGETEEPNDNNGHGTFINGIIAGAARVDLVDKRIVNEFTGGNDNSNIAIQQLNVSFTPPNSDGGTLFDALCGIHYSLSKKARVINASWGLVTYGDNIKEMVIFKSTLEAVAKADAILVVSAGNDTIDFEHDAKRRLAWPAAFSRKRDIAGSTFDFHNNIITVGAWNLEGTGSIAYFSNRGDLVDIYAPGFNVLSLARTNDSRYVKDDLNNKGTSFAAPFITRTAAIMRGLKPIKTAGEIKQSITGNAQVSPTDGTSHLVRHGATLSAF
jgi:subtilisin family serine protease